MAARVSPLVAHDPSPVDKSTLANIKFGDRIANLDIQESEYIGMDIYRIYV